MEAILLLAYALVRRLRASEAAIDALCEHLRK
jgi:hypothetical protein